MAKEEHTEVRFLRRKEIDDRRWDDVIAGSSAETLYAYSWYLDAASGNWSALMIGNYRFVMPLVWHRKYGLKVLYQPFFAQQLGVFSREYVDPLIIGTMLKYIYKKFRIAYTQFNAGNLVSEGEPFTVVDRTNYVLDLGNSYEELRDGYSLNAKRNIDKAYKLNSQIDRELTCEALVDFKYRHNKFKRSEAERMRLLRLLRAVTGKGAGLIYGSRSSEGIDAAVFFGFSRTRVIYLVSASSQQGKELRSMFRLVDAFIREHAGRSLILDFEGSNIPSLARFFAGFGAKQETYQGVGFSRLPAIVDKIRKNG